LDEKVLIWKVKMDILKMNMRGNVREKDGIKKIMVCGPLDVEREREFELWHRTCDKAEQA
jgi:hypothetical protein